MSRGFRLKVFIAVPVFIFVASVAWFSQTFPLSFDASSYEATSRIHALPGIPPIGIGFDLSAFYGSATLSFPDGSSVNVARLEATSEYCKAMKKLSLDSSVHPVPPYNSQGEYNADRPRQLHRQARKAAGFPASHEVGAISALLQDLRSAVEDHLGHGIDRAVISTPHLVALYEEDLADVAEYLGLELNYLPYWHNHMTETGAAYVGYGLGLCSNYTDPPGCNAEMKAMPSENVMAVLYTKDALTVTLSKMQSAWYMWEPRYRYREHFNLGFDALEQCSNEEEFWEYVRQALMGIMVAYPLYPRPDKVLLMGECVEYKQFRKVLEDSLASLMEHMPEILVEDPIYVAAKGAAELAKRGPYYPWMQDHYIFMNIESDNAERDAKARTEDSKVQDKLHQSQPSTYLGSTARMDLRL